MPYVMVPVPEEHVTEAMEMILRIIAKASVKPWDEEALVAFFLGADEPTRSVLSVVSRGVLAKGQISDVDVSASIELSQREVLGIVREANEKAARDARPALLTVRQVSETLPNGRVTEQRVVTMGTDVAEFVRAAERVERQSVGNPLGNV